MIRDVPSPQCGPWGGLVESDDQHCVTERVEPVPLPDGLVVCRQDQVATVKATNEALTVTVTARDGKLVESFTLNPRR